MYQRSTGAAAGCNGSTGGGRETDDATCGTGSSANDRASRGGG
jgi:hypothetical protein